MRTGNRRSAGGFAYMLVLLAIALIGIAASASVSLGATATRRQAEQQLLVIGLEFQQALRSYAGVPLNVTVSAAGQGPRSVEDLLRDPRVPGIRRHLRQIYADPLTGKQQWGLVRDARGLIVGIHSLHEGKPIQRTGFDHQLASFEGKASYREWVFGLPSAQATQRSSTPN